MKLRVGILVVLAALAIGYRASSIYMWYFSPDLASHSPLKTKLDQGYMVVDAIMGLEDVKWDPSTVPAKPGDRLLELYDDQGHGGPIHNLYDFGAYLRPVGVDETWTIVVDRPKPDGSFERLRLTMPPPLPVHWSAAEWVTKLGLDVFVPVAAMIAGLLVGLMRPRDNQAFLIGLAFLLFSVSFRQPVSQLPAFWKQTGLVLTTTGSHLASLLLMQFFLFFPRRSPIDRRAPWLRYVLFVGVGFLWALDIALTVAAHVSFDAHRAIFDALKSVGLTEPVLTRISFVLGFTIFVVSLTAIVLSTKRAESQGDQRRMKIIAVGALAGLTPLGISSAVAMAGIKVSAMFSAIAILLVVLFPASFVYAVVKHRVFGIRVMVRKGLRYALVSRGFLIFEGVVIFAALYFAAAPLFERLVPGADSSLASVGTAAVTLGLLAGIRRVNHRVLPVIDRHFFRDVYNAHQVLADLAHAIRQLSAHPDQLVRRVSDEITNALHPAELALFLAEGGWAQIPEPEVGAACWTDPRDSAAPRYTLRLHRRADQHLLPDTGARLGLGGTILGGRIPLATALHAESPRDLEAVDVFPLDRRPVEQEAPAQVRAGTCLEERALYERFGTRLVVPLVTNGKTLGFLLFGEKLSEEPYSREDKELLLRVAEQVATALDYSQLIGQVAEQERMKREMQIAQEVQAKLFPHERPPLRTLEYAGVCRAAFGVGGDYFDFVPLEQERLGIAVGDISGKGLSAALLMASLQALLRSHAPTRADRLADLARELNHHLYESTDDARFATLFFGVYDDRDRTLRYINAGHVPPILVREGGTKVERLGPNGMVLGLFPEELHEPDEVRLAPGDVLLLFSDGVSESMDADGELFGEQRLVETVVRHAGAPADELPELIMAEVAQFTGRAPQADDLTLISARCR
ncbi:MAG: SpoIIE family protein phosphatase [Acidobacteria bacterium]|nr:SpoIIE family protein phosphatase [Acidobacteriota bacterium]